MLSHCCVRCSNRIAHSSVQVLVTVIYISFSKYVLAVINVFTSADIYSATTTYNVWYWEGSVKNMVNCYPSLSLLIIAGPIQCTKVNDYV